jgi:hypothetical protein
MTVMGAMRQTIQDMKTEVPEAGVVGRTYAAAVIGLTAAWYFAQRLLLGDTVRVARGRILDGFEKGHESIVRKKRLRELYPDSHR